MSRPLLLAASMAVLAALTSACQTTSVVRTTEVGAATPPQGRPYLVYPLATTMIVVTVKKAGGGADKAEAPPTNVNTVSIQNWAAVKPDTEEEAEPPKPKPLPCGKVRAKYAVVAAKRERLISDYRLRLNSVNVLWDKSVDLGDVRKQQQLLGLLADHKAAALEDEANLAEAKALEANFEESNCDAFTIEVGQKIVADPTRTVALYFRDDAFSADKLSIKLDANGFPAAITSSADEKTGEVVSAGLKSIAYVAGLVSTGVDLSSVGSMKATVLTPGDGAAAPRRAALNRDKSRKSKPLSNRQFRAKVAGAVAKLLQGGPSSLPALPDAPPEYPIQQLISEIDKVAPNAKATAAVSTGPIKIYQEFTYEISCAPLPPSLAMVEPKKAPTKVLEGQPGLIISGQRTCEVQIAEGGVAVSRTVFLAADPRSRQIVPISRSSLIARTDGYEFVDGRMTSMAYDKPSDALAAVSLPFKVGGDIISGFSTAVQGRQGLVKAQSDLIEARANQTKAEAEIYNAKAALLKAQTDLIAAQDAAEKARKDRLAAANQP